MRKKIFTGSQAQRERKAFKEFLIKYLKDKMNEIKDMVFELVICDQKNRRTSEILQKLFIEIYELYIKGNYTLESNFIKSLRIRNTGISSKFLEEIVENMKEVFK